MCSLVIANNGQRIKLQEVNLQLVDASGNRVRIIKIVFIDVFIKDIFWRL